MIQANELRIGNYIYNEVQEINFKACSVVIHRLSHGDSEGYKPIELTEEILLKCGFELINFKAPSINIGLDLFYGYNYAIMKIGYKTDFIIRYKKNKFKIESFYSSELKHLHQLQNLYFALTGQELEINL